MVALAMTTTTTTMTATTTTAVTTPPMVDAVDPTTTTTTTTATTNHRSTPKKMDPMANESRDDDSENGETAESSAVTENREGHFRSVEERDEEDEEGVHVYRREGPQAIPRSLLFATVTATPPSALNYQSHSPIVAERWPERSPCSLPQFSKDGDEASFALLNQSFDTLSSSGPTLQQQASPPKRHPYESICLPSLGHSTMQDISPIRDPYEPLPFQGSRSPPSPPCTPPPTVTPARPRGFQEVHPTDEYVSNPTFVLRSCSKAFNHCTFVLSHIRAANPCPVNLSDTGSFQQYNGRTDCTQYSLEDLLLAARRVKAAVCAFGGNMNALCSRTERDAIFRPKVDAYGAWINPSSHHKRYRVQESRISWEMEEHPPVETDSPGTVHPSSRRKMQAASPEPPATPEGPPKLKYRCKLCGQPKQNHRCPYRQSIQRSIGIMVYPALNAFAAKEPGDCAPALSDMNNFVSYESTEAESPKNTHLSGAKKVSPSSTQDGIEKKVSVESTLLRPEQFRAVSVENQHPDAYRYMSVPLTFPERKRLSDTLFVLSQEVLHWTEEIAGLLTEARQRGMWDLAVAELLTQVIVALYCGEGDKRLDGLRQYLVNRGISC